MSETVSLRCFFCRRPAETISFGFAICDGNPPEQNYCANRALAIGLALARGDTSGIAMELNPA